MINKRIKKKRSSRSNNLRLLNFNKVNKIKRKSLTDNHFYIWKGRIEQHVLKEINYLLDDLPDQPYRYWFEQGYLTPKQVSIIIIANYYQYCEYYG